MTRWMLFSLKVLSVLAAAIALAGCEPEPTVAPPGAIGTQSAAILPTVTPIQPTPSPTATEIPREFISYYHRSGVFAIAYPSDWEAVDGSTDQRLLVRFDPPIGFGSRVTIDITNDGQLTPPQVLDRLESYIQLNYSGNPAYSQISQDTLADGRIQAVFMYDDGRGGKGRETLTIQQTGPYFVALRIFLADSDAHSLSATLNTMAASLMVDPQAAWGSQVAAINPAELLVINTLLWQDRTGGTHYTGEVYNASPSDASNVQVRVALCDKNGIVLTEVTGDAALKVVPKGAAIPFSIIIEGMPRGTTVCSEQASGEPAHPDPNYTTALTLESSSKYIPRSPLAVEGRVSNPGLVAVTNIQVVIAVYDSQGRVIAFATPDLGIGLRLEPGQSQPFDFTFLNMGGQPDHFALFVEAEIASTASPSLNPGGGS